MRIQIFWAIFKYLLKISLLTRIRDVTIFSRANIFQIVKYKYLRTFFVTAGGKAVSEVGDC